MSSSPLKNRYFPEIVTLTFQELCFNFGNSPGFVVKLHITYLYDINRESDISNTQNFATTGVHTIMHKHIISTRVHTLDGTLALSVLNKLMGSPTEILFK